MFIYDLFSENTGKQKERYDEFFSSAELGQRAVKIVLFCFANALVCMSLLQYKDQTWFFMLEHSPGPVGGVENRGRRLGFSIPPKGPGEC